MNAQLPMPGLQRENEAHDGEHPSDHLRTPAELLARVHQLDDIGLDPCAVRASLVDARIEWHGPPHEAENGLTRSWAGHGLVYCFPPPRQAAAWAHKIVIEAQRGVEIVALFNCRTDAAWLHDYVFPTAAAVCYWRGSLRALGEPRKSVHPRAIAYWGQRAGEFRDAFATAGTVVLGADVHRSRSWLIVVPRPTPTGTWVTQKGKRSQAVKDLLQRFADDLSLANALAPCPPATAYRHAIITRHGNRPTSPQSLERGGQLIVDLLCREGLLSRTAGYDLQWRQAIDRRRPRTEILVTEDPAG